MPIISKILCHLLPSKILERVYFGAPKMGFLCAINPTKKYQEFNIHFNIYAYLVQYWHC